ncbi:MAG: hypothetical protein WAO08_02450, partial [Hyphomicrobiaceae bacterium]
MFTKRTEKEGTGGGAGVVAQRSVAGPGHADGQPLSETASVVGRGLSIKGNLESKGEVQIDGAI